MKLIIGNLKINSVSNGASVNVGTTLNLIDLGKLKEEQIPPEKPERPEIPETRPPRIPPVPPTTIRPEAISHATIQGAMLPHPPPC